MPRMIPIDVREQLPHERRELLALLRSLAPAEWAAPTACAGWTVRDVVAHILGGDAGILSRLRDGAPGATLSPGPGLVAALNQRNEQWVTATGWLSPRLLCDLLELVGEQTGAYFGTLDPEAPGEVVSWAGPDPAPNRLAIARHYTERWHHQQHIRDAVGRPGLTDRWSCGPVIAAFAHALPRAFDGVDLPDETSVELRVSGEAGGSWIVSNPSGRWQLVDAASAPPAAIVTLDQDPFWRLCTKGISREAAPAQATISGDRRLAERVFNMVAILA